MSKYHLMILSIKSGRFNWIVFNMGNHHLCLPLHLTRNTITQALTDPAILEGVR